MDSMMHLKACLYTRDNENNCYSNFLSGYAKL